MDDEQRRSGGVGPKRSLLPVLVGVCAFAALGMGGVQLYMSKRGAPQTDARASRLPAAQPTAAPTARPSVKAASEPARAPIAPAMPSLAAPSAKVPAPQLTKSQPAAAQTSSAHSVSAPRAPEPAALPAQPAQALPAEVPSAQPERPSGSARAERSRPPVNIDPSLIDPPAPAAASVLSVTPITPPAEPAAPEPEPAVDTVSAADYAKQSSGALLRGEQTRAIDLARRATQADPGYAIAWRSLGLAYERAGSVEQALSAYREYLQRAPTGPQAEMVRQRMQSLTQ
jgi:hypothetical protein